MSVVADRYRAPCAAQSGCRQCGVVIGARSAYCSGTCRDTFERQHFYGTARRWAIELWAKATDATCNHCGKQAAHNARYYYDPRFVDNPWLRFGLHEFYPEVNHIAPLNRQRGTSYHFGCFNHQGNLEVVCHRCHVRVTVEQRAAGLIGKPKAPRPEPPAVPVVARLF